MAYRDSPTAPAPPSARKVGFEAGRRISRLRHAISINKTNDHEAKWYPTEKPLEDGWIRVQESTTGWLLKGVVAIEGADQQGDVFITEEGKCYKNPVAAGVIYFALGEPIPIEEWAAHGIDAREITSHGLPILNAPTV